MKRNLKVVWLFALVGLLFVMASTVYASTGHFQTPVPPAVDFGPAVIASVLAGLLSFVFNLFPKLNTWFAALDNDTKKTIMGVASLVIGVAIYVLACVPSLGFPLVACPTGGIWTLLFTLWLAVTTNTGVDRSFPKSASVQKAAAEGDAKRTTK